MGGETCIESELFEERVPVSKYRYTAGYVSGLFQRQSTLFCGSVLSIQIIAVLCISAPNFDDSICAASAVYSVHLSTLCLKTVQG